MGKTNSKTVIAVPIESVHEGSTDFISHHVHSGTLKSAVGAFAVMLLVIALLYQMYKKAMKRREIERHLPIVRYEAKTREVLPNLG